MNTFTRFVVKYRYIIMGLFALLIIGSFFLIPQIKVNYDFAEYIDKDTETITALNKMTEEFGTNSNAQIMLENVDIAEVNTITAGLQKIDGVSAVLFDEISGYIADGGKALIRIVIADGEGTDSAKTVDDIRAALSGYTIAMSGGPVNSLVSGVKRDMLLIMISACIVVLLILILTSTSWIDPVVFIIVVFSAIIINMGTNALMGGISFLTHSICMVMQLALAMDYSIMLLHRFNEERAVGKAARDAAAVALRKTFAPVSSSSLTTIAGLLALVFMRFTLGFDIGAVLAKGVIISLFTTLLLMPGILVVFAPLLDKTKHRSLHSIVKAALASGRRKKQEAYDNYINQSVSAELLSANNILTETPAGNTPINNTSAAGAWAENASAQNAPVINAPSGKMPDGTNPAGNTAGGKRQRTPRPPRTFAGFQLKSRIAVPIVLVLLTVTGFVLQMNMDYSYAIDISKDPNAQINVDKNKIDEAFGIQNTIVIMLPNNRAAAASREELNTAVAREKALIEYLCGEYSYNGKTVVTSGQGIVSLGYYDEMTLAEAIITYAAMAGIPEDAALQLAGIVPDITIRPIELINLLLSADGNLTERIVYLSKKYYGNKTAAGFAEIYNIDADTASGLYTAVGLNPAKEQRIFGVIQYICVNRYFADNAELQKQFDLLYALGAYPITRGMLNGFGLTDESVNLMFTLLSAPSEDYIPIYDILRNIDTAAVLLEPYLSGSDQILNLMELSVTMFDGANYTRLLFNLSLPTGSNDIFKVIDEINIVIKERFGEAYLMSESSTLNEIYKMFPKDSVVINLISFFAILLIIMITFRSLTVPVILTVLIQGAIWITMSFTMLASTPLFFLCYLVIMCIQMGATVDYAILMTDRYVRARATMNKRDAITDAFDNSIMTLLTSGSILVLAAFIVGIISNIPMISTLGLVLSLGCLVSLVLIIFALPQVLLLCDKLIEKTTYKAKFYKEPVSPVGSRPAAAYESAQNNEDIKQ